MNKRIIVNMRKDNKKIGDRRGKELLWRGAWMSVVV